MNQRQFLVTTPRYHVGNWAYVDRALVDAEVPHQAAEIAAATFSMANAGFVKSVGEIEVAMLDVLEITSVENALGVSGPGRIATVKDYEFHCSELTGLVKALREREPGKWQEFFDARLEATRRRIIEEAIRTNFNREMADGENGRLKTTCGFLAGVVAILTILVGLAMYTINVQRGSLDLLQARGAGFGVDAQK